MTKETTLKLILTQIIIIALSIILFQFSVKAMKPIKIDYNCSDFTSKEEAQKFFNKNEEDIYRLDGDGDGIPCEIFK